MGRELRSRPESGRLPEAQAHAREPTRKASTRDGDEGGGAREPRRPPTVRSLDGQDEDAAQRVLVEELGEPAGSDRRDGQLRPEHRPAVQVTTPAATGLADADDRPGDRLGDQRHDGDEAEHRHERRDDPEAGPLEDVRREADQGEHLHRPRPG